MNSLRRSMARAVFSVCLVLVPISSAFAQTPPTYPELFANPPRADQLTQTDLPNLARIVVLESIAMFSNVTSELYEIREDSRLQNLVRNLWYEADQFNAAVSLYPTVTEAVAAGRLVFPDLAAAFDEVRGTLGRLPGTAPRTAANFANLSRVIAVIGPLLEQAVPATIAGAVNGEPATRLDAFRVQAQEIAQELTALQDRLKKLPGPTLSAREIEPRLAMLAQLVQGFARVVSAEPGEREAAESFRPIRSTAEEVHQAVVRSDLPLAFKSEWGTIRGLIDNAAEGFDLPRQIAVRGRAIAPFAPVAQATSSSAITREIDSAVDLLSREAGRVPADSELAALEHELQLRLVVLRQQLLGGQPAPRLRQAFNEVETARRLLEERSRPIVRGRPQAHGTLNRDAEAAIAQIRSQLFKSR